MRYATATIALMACLGIGQITQGQVPKDVPRRGFDIGICCPSGKMDTVIVYSADWCTPCKAMKPRLEALRKQGYRVVIIDTESHTADRRLTDWEQKRFLDKTPKRIPTMVFVNSDRNEEDGERFIGTDYTNEQIKERMWNPLLSTDWVLERLP